MDVLFGAGAGEGAAAAFVPLSAFVSVLLPDAVAASAEDEDAEDEEVAEAELWETLSSSLTPLR